MATFKVGQRVKLARSRNPEDQMPGRRRYGSPGATGTVTSMLPPWWRDYGDCIVRADGAPNDDPNWGGYAAFFYQLEPLTDPGADAFMERIKKLKPYDEPKVSVTTEHGTALFPK